MASICYSNYLRAAHNEEASSPFSTGMESRQSDDSTSSYFFFKSECKWPKSKGFNFSCREFYLVKIKRQWQSFEEFVWIPTKAERREGWLEPETVGSDNGESDPFEGILDRWGNKTNFICFHFFVQVGWGVWRNKSNFVCFQFLLAAHSPLSPSKPKFS